MRRNKTVIVVRILALRILYVIFGFIRKTVSAPVSGNGFKTKKYPDWLLAMTPDVYRHRSADALLDLQRFYREGKASEVTNDVERLIGRKPLTFDQFATDDAFAFQAETRAAS